MKHLPKYGSHRLSGSSQRKIGTVLSYVYQACGLVINLVYTPVMIRLLGQSEYGLYTLVGSVVSYLGLFSFGFTGAYLRFYSRYREKGDDAGAARLNGMFLTVFLCMGAVAFVCGMALAQFSREVFGGNLTDADLATAKRLMQILVVNIAMTFPSSVFDSIVGSQEQFLFQRLLSLAGLFFNPLICLPLLLMGHGSVAVVGVTTLITAARLSVNIWFCIARLKTPFSFSGFEFGLLKEISVFSFFLFLNMIIDQVNLSVDKLILGRVAGTIEVAVYGIATQFTSKFMAIATAISSVFAPQVNRIAASDDGDKNRQISDLFIKVGRLQYMLMLYVFVGFVFCGRQFILWWAGAEYADSYVVALLLLSPLVIVLPHSLGVEIRRAKNRHQVASVIMSVTTVFNLLISIPLAKRYGAAGAAFGTWLEFLVNMTFIDVYYAKMIRIDIRRFYANIGKITIASLAPVLFGMAGMKMAGILGCAGWVLLYSAAFWLCLYRFAMNRKEKELVQNVLRKASFWRKRDRYKRGR